MVWWVFKRCTCDSVAVGPEPSKAKWRRRGVVTHTVTYCHHHGRAVRLCPMRLLLFPHGGTRRVSSYKCIIRLLLRLWTTGLRSCTPPLCFRRRATFSHLTWSFWLASKIYNLPSSSTNLPRVTDNQYANLLCDLQNLIGLNILL